MKNRLNLFIVILSLSSCIGSKKSTVFNKSDSKSGIITSTESIIKLKDYANYSVSIIKILVVGIILQMAILTNGRI